MQFHVDGTLKHDADDRNLTQKSAYSGNQFYEDLQQAKQI